MNNLEMPSTDLKNCVPELQEKIPVLIQKCKEQGIYIAITCTSRTQAEQNALYAQGRKTLNTVNELRHDSGMSHITKEYNHIVTWTLDSKHVINSKRPLSEAIDFCLMVKGVPDWIDIKSYIKVATIAKELGLKSGMDFSKKDYPHIEV